MSKFCHYTTSTPQVEKNTFINMETYAYVPNEFMYKYECVSVCPHMNTFSDYPIHKKTEYIYKYQYICVCPR